jgi:cytochrome b6-f complex iron-sulfur subunit
MDATGIFIVGILVAGLLALAGIFAVAFRRGPTDGPVTAEELDRRARAADEAARAKRVVTTGNGDREAVAVITVEEVDEAFPPQPTADPLTERVEVSPDDYSMTRRQFFNRALLAVFGLFLLQFAIASIAFVWPKLKGGFGTPINAGPLLDIKAAANQPEGVVPQFIPAAQSWVTTFPLNDLPGSSFEGTPEVIAGGADDGIGLMALWQKCVHLGCRVPTCIPSQGFECPCHGSKYNIHGEYELGPAPRNLDRFVVEVNDAGDLIINTGTVIETPRAQKKTATYPQGPFCV